jgi:malonyl-CoA O-methyltransferase
MQQQTAPTIDPIAAKRWARTAPNDSPWLHEEVARRMEQRLQWIVAQPKRWLHWEPSLGGLNAHALLQQRYPGSIGFALEPQPTRKAKTMGALQPAWWSPSRWTRTQTQFDAPKEQVQMIWANMALHPVDDPVALIGQWFEVLETDGFLMFSCLGPDTLRELRALYAQQGWPPPSHEFTDMHDWGDMLVHAGFAEPVMDMERITLSYSTPANLLEELRTLGRNLHKERFPALRGKRWYGQLQAHLQAHLQVNSQANAQANLQNGLQPSEAGTRLECTFEIIYGHAFKPVPRARVDAQSSISLQQMRAELGLNKLKGRA